MTKRTEENFIHLCDILSVEPNYAEAARRMNITTQTIFRWLQESQRGTDWRRDRQSKEPAHEAIAQTQTISAQGLHVWL